MLKTQLSGVAVALETEIIKKFGFPVSNRPPFCRGKHARIKIGAKDIPGGFRLERDSS